MLLFLFLDIGKFCDRPKRVGTIGEKDGRFSKILRTSCLSMIVFSNYYYYYFLYKQGLNNIFLFLIFDNKKLYQLY